MSRSRVHPGRSSAPALERILEEHFGHEYRRFKIESWF
jgi:hypothetical protein